MLPPIQSLPPTSTLPPGPPLHSPAGQAEATPPASAAAGPLLPNPRLVLDAGLGLVVLQFRDAAGAVAHSLPTERELAAYRRASPPAPGPMAPPAVQANSASSPLPTPPV